MKKLYTILFSLFICASSFAQISLSVDGQKVAHQGSLTKIYNVEAKDKIPGMPQFGQVYGLYPKIMVTSQKAQEVIVTVIDKSQDQGTQFCYGTTCDELYKMDFTSQKIANLEAGKATDLAIHIVRQSSATAPYEVELQIDAYGTLDQQRCTSTVILKYDPSASAVQTIVKEQSSSPYYTLGGQRVAMPRKGIYIKDGRKVVIK